MDKITTDHIGRLLLLGILLLFIEISFFNSGLIFSLLISGGSIYLGKKRYSKTFGKILFWFGCISLLITVINMFTFKFLLIAIIIYVLIYLFKTKRHPIVISPELQETQPVGQTEVIYKKRLFFQNRIYGNQTMTEQSYEWQDVNIQNGIGDSIIDLSYTVLPKGESVIMIRNLIGNVKIFVPYDLELSVNHSTIVGEVNILGNKESKQFNRSYFYETAGFELAEQRIKIVTSMGIGDIEVKRI